MTIRTAACLSLLVLCTAGCQALRGRPGAAAGPQGHGAQADGATRILRGKLFHHLTYHQSFPADRDDVLVGLAASIEMNGWEREEVRRRLGRSAQRFERVGEVMMMAGLGKAPCAPVVEPAPEPVRQAPPVLALTCSR